MSSRGPGCDLWRGFAAVGEAAPEVLHLIRGCLAPSLVRHHPRLQRGWWRRHSRGRAPRAGREPTAALRPMLGLTQPGLLAPGSPTSTRSGSARSPVALFQAGPGQPRLRRGGSAASTPRSARPPSPSGPDPRRARRAGSCSIVPKATWASLAVPIPGGDVLERWSRIYAGFFDINFGRPSPRPSQQCCCLSCPTSTARSWRRGCSRGSRKGVLHPLCRGTAAPGHGLLPRHPAPSCRRPARASRRNCQYDHR